MSVSISKIKYQKKYYWTAKKPVQINNMILAEDWNKYQPIEACVEVITDLSSVLTSLFNDPINISNYLIIRTDEKYPSTSILSTIDGSTNDNMYGISTLKINDTISCGTINAWFLPDGAQIVNTLNGKDGNVTSILSGIKINDGETYKETNVNLGNYLSEDLLFVKNINKTQTGDCWVISSIVLQGTEYNNIVDNYIDISSFDNQTMKRTTTLSIGYIQESDDTNIVNLQYYNKNHQCSAILPANTLCTFYNVIDWISLTNDTFEILQPTVATLLNGTLTIKSETSGKLYYVSKI